MDQFTGHGFPKQNRKFPESLPVTKLLLQGFVSCYRDFHGFPTELPVSLKWREEMKKEEGIKERHFEI